MFVDAGKSRLGRWFPGFVEPDVIRLLRRTLLSYGAHACGIYAGALAFFAVLALFPLLLLLITLFAIFVHRSDASALVLERTATFLPGSASFVVEGVDAVLAAQPVLLGLGTIGLLWSSLGIFLTLGYALNRVWEVPNDRPLLAQYAISTALALSVGGLLLLSLLLSALLVALHLVQGALAGLDLPDTGVLVFVASDALDLVIVAIAAAVLYRVLPNTAVRWRDVLLPAFLMAFAREGAKLGFNWYLNTFAQVDRIYGPIAALIGLLLWLYVSSILFLLGAELSRQIARSRAALPRPKEPAHV